MDKIRVDGIPCKYFENEQALKDSGFFGFIYVTKCLTNGKFYVGKSRFEKNHGGVKARQWQNYLGSGYDLKADVKRYGRENFKRAIIDVATDEQQLTQLEANYIAQFSAIVKDNWYNSPRKRRKNGLKSFENICKDW